MKAASALVVAAMLVWAVIFGVERLDPRWAPFLGSFLAAIVTGLALVGNSILQRKREDQRREEDKQFKALQDAMQLLSYLQFLGNCFYVYIGFIELAKYNTPIGQSPGPNDVSDRPVSALRHLFRQNEVEKAEQALTWTANLPPIIVKAISHEIYSFMSELRATHRFILFAEDSFPHRQNLEGAMNLAKTRKAGFSEVRAELETYLRQRGHLN